MKFESFDFTLSEHFLVYLEYGDTSNLTDDEETQFIDWLDIQWHNAKIQYPNVVGYHWSIGDDAGFCRCEITGLYSTCYNVKMMITVKE